MLAIPLLIVAVILGVVVFVLGCRAGWHWAGSLVAAIVPFGFTFFMGVLGLLIAFGFTFSVYKFTS